MRTAVAPMRAAIARLDAGIAWLEGLALGLLVLAMTGVTLSQVFWRYALNAPLIWSEEAARYLFVWVAMVGAGLAMHQGGHYALAAFTMRLPAPVQRLARAVAVVVSAGFLVILLRAGIAETRQAAMQDSSTLPMTMDLAYLAIPIGAGLMLFHLVAGLFRQDDTA
jgi:TRAP-type C4-dicarboxylate transport system permease small subunit